MKYIATEIISNKKRMAKIASLPTREKRREKARGYVVAEAQRKHVRLSEDEILDAAFVVVRSLVR